MEKGAHDMKTALILTLLFAMCASSAFAGESGDTDHERPLVQQGVLGTVNVLRELDVKTWTNRVTVTSNVEGRNNSKPEDTIDGSGKTFHPQVDKVKPLVLTYMLPGPRTVSSLAIAYGDGGSDAPAQVQLEGSSDGGKTWFEVFKSKARKSDFLKCFKPAKVNALRLTQEGDGTDTCGRHTKEVVVYADAESPLPLFGDKDSGAFNFLRGLWYADKLKLVWKPENKGVWTTMNAGLMGGERFPEILLFKAGYPTQHDGGFGDAVEKGKRLYLRFDLDKAYPMNYGLIGTTGGDRCNFGLHPAEFYTANGHLDPLTLKGSSINDLTGQGWILQKAWDKDPNIRKDFLFAHPGKFNQMLVVWDAFQTYENDRWSHLEMFGSETPAKGNDAKAKP
jgi:hypothetical protein